MKRKGQFNVPGGSALSDSMQDAMIAIEVISAVIGLVTGIGAIVVALREMADSVVRAVLKLTFEQVMKAIGQLVSKMGAIIQARSMTKASIIGATRKAQDDYQTSDAHAQVTTNQTTQINALNTQLASSQINSSTYAARLQSINTAASVKGAVNLTNSTKTAVEKAQKDDETLNWIMMGLSIGLSILSGFAGAFGGMASKIGTKLAALLEKIQAVFSAISMFTNALSAGLQGYPQQQLAQPLTPP